MLGGYEPAFNPGFPLYYKGRERNQIFLSGAPFRDVNSAYQEIRTKVGLDNIAGRNPAVSLDPNTRDDLLAEGIAYFFRANLYPGELGIRSPKAGVQNFDHARTIFRLIRNHTDDEAEKSRMQELLDNSSILSNLAFSEMLGYEKNYAWAKQLLSQSLDILSTPESREINFYFHFANNSFRQIDISNPYNMKWGECITQIMQGFEQIQVTTLPPHNNLLPDPEPHPESLEAEMCAAVAEERYLDAAKLRNRISAIKGMFLERLANPNPFIRYVGFSLLSGLTEYGLDMSLDKGEMQLERIVDGERRLVVHVKGNETDSEKVFNINDADLHTRVLHLIHSDPYVIMFGRFNTDLIMVPSKDISE